ncbi:MAG: T9SS type A sorting domain-containing protein [Bacteroidales bacterium]|nr:T9SS type A sorting domain-containing protein [Bacteroidales bacterium]
MKKVYIVLSILAIASRAISQVVTTDPVLPSDELPVTITFYSDEGNKGLMDYAGDDVYAHTGVITDSSTSLSGWRYVKAAWTSNIAACKLTKISANEYQLSITPDIRTYYGVPPTEKILKMAFVFRNANAGRTGRDVGNADIFAFVYEEGLQVSFIQPAESFTFTHEGELLPFEVNSSNADSLALFLDGQPIRKLSGSEFDTVLTVSGYQRHELIVKAKNENELKTDTSWFMVPHPTTQASLPAGVHDGITYPETDSVVFVLFAPGKTNIYLIGDFNNWLPDSVYQFRKDGDRFWLALGNLVPEKEYAFQYIIDSTLRIADPYAEKIMDPDNDKDIPATVYPNLLSYPATKTQQIAGVIQPGKQHFAWDNLEYSPPADSNLVIYELLIRDFVTTHDIKDVAAKLDYLQTLGVNAIELMPFSEFEGNISWGYNPSFYFATDKYYGTSNDFKEFIQECHSRGMAVIMDMVLNHAYGQNPMVRMYFNAATGKPTPENPWFNETSPNTAYSWGNDFNHESQATEYFVDRVVEYWLSEYKVDGFRFDFTKGFTNTPGDGSTYDALRIAILKRIYDKVKAVNPNAYMICEHFAPNNEEKELSDYGMLIWGNSNYNYNEATMGYLNNSDFSWSSYKAREWKNPHLVSYMESHDEERLMFKNITYGNASGDYNIKDPATALKRNELAGVFYFAIPGPKMIWQFGELGYDVSIDYIGRVEPKPVRWEYYDDADRRHLYLVWAKMLDLRKKYPVFSTNDFTLNVGNGVANKKIVLRHEEGDALVIGNFGMAEAGMQPGFTATGWWYEVFSGDSVNITDLSATVTLNAGEYRIFTNKKMSSVINGKHDLMQEKLQVYPNPATDKLTISNEMPIGRLEIINLAGFTVMVDDKYSHQKEINIESLPPGFYLLLMHAGNRVLTGKFVKQ